MLRLAGAQHRRQLAVPCREAALFCLARFRAAVQLSARLPHLCADACRPLLAQIAASFFVPFCLTAATVIARLRILSSALLAQLVDVYSTLVTFAAALPCAHVASTGVASNAFRVAESVQLAWNVGLPQAVFIPFQSGQGGFDELAAQLQQQHAVLQHAGVSQAKQKGVSLYALLSLCICCTCQCISSAALLRTRPDR